VSAVARGDKPLGTMGAMLMSKKITAGDVKLKRAYERSQEIRSTNDETALK
jgi:hypothetical protein